MAQYPASRSKLEPVARIDTDQILAHIYKVVGFSPPPLRGRVRVGGTYLVLDDDGGAVRRPFPERGHRTVRHVHAAVGPVIEVGTGAIPGAPGRVVDEVAAPNELYGEVGPRVRVPVRAAVGPGRDHLVGRVASEDVV